MANAVFMRFSPEIKEFTDYDKNTFRLPRQNMPKLLKTPKNHISFETIITVYYHFTTCEMP